MRMSPQNIYEAAGIPGDGQFFYEELTAAFNDRSITDRQKISRLCDAAIGMRAADINTIDPTQRFNIIRFVEDYTDAEPENIKKFMSETLLERLKYPDDESPIIDDLTTPHEKVAYIEYLVKQGFFDTASPMAYATALDQLYPIATAEELERGDNFSLTLRAMKLAFWIQFNDPKYERMEAYEDSLITKLHACLEKNPEVQRARSAWNTISLEQKLGALGAIKNKQGEIFGFEPADRVATFSLSPEQHAELLKSKFNQQSSCVYPAGASIIFNQSSATFYPGITAKEGEHVIALNIHPAALDDLDDCLIAEGVVVHEGNHVHQKRLKRARANHLISPRHPYYDFSTQLFSTSPWGRISPQFYYVDMKERHSYAIDNKYMHLRINNIAPLPSEKAILSYNLSAQGRRGTLSI